MITYLCSQAGEKAAFMVLKFLNLVENYGDRVPQVQTTDNALLDLNLQFLRLQQRLQDLQCQQNMVDTRPPQPLCSMSQEADALQQSVVRSQMQQQQQQQQQQQKMQMMFTALQLQQPPRAKVPLQQPSMLQQQVLRHTTAYPQPMSPFQPPARQMTVATNYVYQNIASKYPLPGQQLYYQNVQNIYYNQS